MPSDLDGLLHSGTEHIRLVAIFDPSVIGLGQNPLERSNARRVRYLYPNSMMERKPVVDSEMEDDAIQRIAEREAQDVSSTWNAIRADLRKAGPFSKMILSFRESATDALADLVAVNPNDPAAVAKLQAEVRRYVSTIEIIHGFREGAAAVDANAELTPEQELFLQHLEEPEE